VRVSSFGLFLFLNPKQSTKLPMKRPASGAIARSRLWEIACGTAGLCAHNKAWTAVASQSSSKCIQNAFKSNHIGNLSWHHACLIRVEPGKKVFRRHRVESFRRAPHSNSLVHPVDVRLLRETRIESNQIKSNNRMKIVGPDKNCLCRLEGLFLGHCVRFWVW
jgi:hypothetical protein